MRRWVILMLLASATVLPAAPATAHPDGSVGCGVSAPLSTRCSSGWHVYDEHHDEASIRGTLYTGVVESVLHHPGGELVAWCDFVAGVTQRCGRGGAEPAEGTLVYHSCESYLIPWAAWGVGEFDCLLR